MGKRVISDARMPAAFGPYSHAVAASGELVFVSGQPGIDVATGTVPPDFATQARNAFQNLATVLAAADLTLADVVKTTVFLADASQFDVLNTLFAEFFPEAPPTRATPVIALPRGLLISIEAIAVRG